MGIIVKWLYFVIGFYVIDGYYCIVVSSWIEKEEFFKEYGSYLILWLKKKVERFF